MKLQSLIISGLGAVSVGLASAQTCTPSVAGMVLGGSAISADGDIVYMNRGAAGVAVLQRTAGGEFVLLGESLDEAFSSVIGYAGSRSISGEGGMVAVVSDAWRSVVLVDASLPSEPAVVGEISLAVGDPDIRSVAVRGSTLFVLSPTGFKAFDVTDPASPVQLVAEPFPDGTHGALEVGDGILLASRGGQVKVWDVTNPSAPAMVSQVAGRALSLDGTTLVTGGASGSQAGFDLYDLSIPSSPMHLGGTTFGWDSDFLSFDGLTLIDGMVVMTFGELEAYYPLAQVFDVSDPQNPVSVFVGSTQEFHSAALSYIYPAVASFHGEIVGGEFVFPSAGQLWAYDDLSAGFMMSHRYGNEVVEPVLKRDGNLVARSGDTLLIGPDAPIDSFVATDTLVHSGFPSWLTNRDFWFAESAGGLLFMTRANLDRTHTDVSMIDLDATGGAAVAGSLTWSGVPSGAVASGEYLYVATSEGRMHVAIESGGVLSDAGQVPLGVPGVQGLVAGEDAVYAHAPGGLAVYDTSNPTSPAYEGYLEDSLARAPFFVVGDHMYAGMNGGAYRVFDLTDPLQPQIETGTSAPLPAGARLLDERDGVLYFLHGNELVRVDVSDPDNQHLLGSSVLAQDWLPGVVDGLDARILGSSLYFFNVVGSGHARVLEVDVEGCAQACPADLAPPFGQYDLFDLMAFLQALEEQAPEADLAAPFGAWDVFDMLAFLDAYLAGCP